MRVIIEGYDLPGRRFCDPSGGALDDVHVGVQVRGDPVHLVPADVETAHWELDIDVVEGPDGRLDFTGGAVHGRRGDRFLYLTWGNVTSGGGSICSVGPSSCSTVSIPGSSAPLTARTELSSGGYGWADDLGAPRCARVDPPDLGWATS